MTVHQKGFSEDEQEVLLILLEHQGYLKKQKLPNGKVWYKRTRKRIPTDVCPECLASEFMHTIECSQADLSSL